MECFPGLTSLEILQKIQKDVEDGNIEPEKFEDRIIFMSTFNDIAWTQRRNSEQCISNSEQVKNYAKRFPRGHWTFFGPGEENKSSGTHSSTLEGNWESTATQVVERFEETDHPVFKSISALSGGILKRKKEQQRHHTLQCGCFEYRIQISKDSHSANQLNYLRSSLKMV